MIKIKCAVCGKEIINPNLRQETCSHKCAKAYNKAYKKAYNKAYHKTDKYKAYNKAYYQRKKLEEEK